MNSRYIIRKVGALRKLRGVCICFTFCHSSIRFLYFATDPLFQTRDLPYYLEQLIFGYAIFLLISAYLIVVLVWVDLYHGRYEKGKVFVKKTKYIFIVLASTIFAIQFAQCTVIGLSLVSLVQEDLLYEVYCVYVAIISFGISGVMLVYGTLVYYKKKRISLTFPQRTEDMTTVVKLTSKVLVISAEFFLPQLFC